MKLNKICRTCLLEKTGLKPLFTASVPDMLMSCVSIQVMQGDGLPHQICTQCLQAINRSYSFKQLCEKSDQTLRQYIGALELQSVAVHQSLIDDVKAEQLLGGNEVLHQSSIFQAELDLAETMQSLQTIAEQCLPEVWETDTQLVSCQSNSETTCSTQAFNMHSLHKCQFCEELFKDEWTLGTHMKIHTGQSKYFCAICGKGCNTTEALNEHSLQHQHQTNQAVSVSVLKENMCSLCDKNFEDVRYLRKHMKDVHFFESQKNENITSSTSTGASTITTTTDHICSICGRVYKQNKFLIAHMKSHAGGNRNLTCEHCGKQFTLQSSFNKHRKLHTGDKKHECTICGKKFSQASNLNIHLAIHAGVKPFVCSLCNKGFSSNTNLKVHRRVHTGEKPYKCSTCEAAFATNTQLKKHIRKHSGEKPYSCWQCGKSFREKETRDTHVRYHTGERPYSCSVCPKKYIAPNHLRAHMKIHKNDRQYQCNICFQKFMETKTLKNHIVTHTGQKLYCCNFCGRSFTHSGSLSTHITKIHKENSLFGGS